METVTLFQPKIRLLCLLVICIVLSFSHAKSQTLGLSGTLELECAEVGDKWSILSDTAASNNQYVVYTGPDQANRSTPVDTTADALVRLNFDLTITGFYVIYIRQQTPNNDDDSYWYRIDGGFWRFVSSVQTEFFWSSLNFLELEAGSHTLEFAYRENGARLDKIFISNRAPSFPLSSDGPEALNLCEGNTPPLAFAGPDRDVIDEESDGQVTFTLDGSGSSDADGEIVSYEWTLNGELIATSEQAEVTVLGTREQNISLTVTDDQGAQGFDELVIRILSQNPGHNDPSFNPEDQGITPGLTDVEDMVLQEDNKLIVVGDFELRDFDGSLIEVSSVLRLNPDGTLDDTFQSLQGDPQNPIISATAVALQLDGKVVVALRRESDKRTMLTRLNSDGTPDLSFQAGATLLGGFGDLVDDIKILDNGKILVGGSFWIVNGLSDYENIIRLNPDGTLDTTFVPAPLVGGSNVTSILPMPDGKIMIGLERAGQTQPFLRLNADGSLDSTFMAPVLSRGSETSVFDIALDPQGNFIIGGDRFFEFPQTANLLRIFPDGSIDEGFRANVSSGFVDEDEVFSIGIQSNGDILVSGDAFRDGNFLKRFDSSGNLDSNFVSCSGTCPDKKILVLPDNSFIGVSPSGLYEGFFRFDKDGNLDPQYGLDTGDKFFGRIKTLATQEDGKILVGGDFNFFGDNALNKIARLNPDGSLDLTFNTGSGFDGSVNKIFALSNGQILISGFFNTYNGFPIKSPALLNPDGSLVESFNLGDNSSSAMLVQPDDKILVYLLRELNGVLTPTINRFNPDGSLDESFNLDPQITDGFPTTLQADGKIILQSSVRDSRGLVIGSILRRLHSDGSLDESFHTGDLFQNIRITDRLILAQPDGKIYVAGEFRDINGEDSINIARLNSDGSLDASFNPRSGFNDVVNALYPQADGKFFALGNFSRYQGVLRPGFARLNADGSLDHTFDPGKGTRVLPSTNNRGLIFDLAIQRDKKILLGGQFNAYDGFPRTNIVRIFGDSIPQEPSLEVRALVLYNTDIQEPVDTLHDGDTVEILNLSNTHLAILALTEPNPVGSVDITLQGPSYPNSFARNEGFAPYSLFGDNALTGPNGQILEAGEYTLRAIPYTERLAQGIAGDGLSISFFLQEPEQIEVRELYLVDALSNQLISRLQEGTVLDLDLSNGRYNLAAITRPDRVGSVKFVISGPKNIDRVENIPPYAAFRDQRGNYFPETFGPGTYQVQATPFTQANGSGAAGQGLALSFTLNDASGEADFTLFPNPVEEGSTHISLKNASEAYLEILNSQGISIFEGMVQDGQSLEGFQKAGYYIFRTVIEGKSQSQVLLVK